MSVAVMTGKYKRKAIPNHLEVRGISRSGTGLEPFHSSDLPSQIIPQDFRDSVQNAITQYDSGSNCSSPLTATYLEPANPNWANLTGNTTDRSSTYSTATYDDFDREASANVERLFSEIDSMLYEGRDSAPAQLYDECKDWSHSFPHLRILGHQVLESQESGYHSVETTPSLDQSNLAHHGGNDSSNHTINHRSRHQSSGGDSVSELSSIMIEGIHVKPAIFNHTTSSIHSHSHLEEDIFAQDGYYEDIIAIDSDQHEDSLDSLSLAAARRQKPSRYPPVTPNACAKNDVFYSAFDVVWIQVNDVMRILLQRYSEHFVINHPMSIPAAEGPAESGHLKLPQITALVPRFDSSLPMPNPHGQQRALAGSVLSRPSPFVVVPSTHDNLNKLLHISKMGMSERRTFIEENGTETPLGIMTSAHHRKGITPRNPSASTKKVHTRSKLAPLNDAARTPNVDDEVLRGTGIGVKRLSSPPVLGLGTRTLPPIISNEFLHGPAPQNEGTTSLSNNNRKSNRASSAVAEKEARLNFREKQVIINETRPSTTHTTYPSDGLGSLQAVANQRSQTPLDRVSKVRTEGILLGITGSSLIGSQAQLDEEEEKYVEHASATHQWAPPHTPGGQYRRSKLNSSFVR